VKPKLLLIHELCGFHGGAEQYIYSTSQDLAQEFELHLLYARKSEKDAERFAQAFTSCHCVDFNADDALAQQWPALCKRLEPDLLYVHKCSSSSLLRAIAQSVIPKIRMVHDHDSYCMRSYKYSPWTRRICERAAGPACLFPCGAFIARDRSARFGLSLKSFRQQMELIQADQGFDAYLLGSNYMCEELERQGYPQERLHIIPPVPRPKDKCLHSSFDDSNTLVFAGQIIRGKGLDCLIESLAQVSVPFHLKVMGEGSHRAYCEELVRSLGLEDYVSFLGFVPHEKMDQVYQQATAVVFPSVWPEPFGAVGLEVMRWGIPVVGFDAGGVRDWLRDGVSGALIPWMDLTAMARALEALLLNKDYARSLGQSAQAFVAKEFGYYATLQRKSALIRSYVS
jgi:glycosyltransferase involved in cell wall biosynthesis